MRRRGELRVELCLVDDDASTSDYAAHHNKISSTHADVHPISLMTLRCIYNTILRILFRVTAENMDAAEDWKMQYNGRYWSSLPHQRPQAPNGSGALALTGECSSSAFVPDISSLDKSLQHCFLVD